MSIEIFKGNSLDVNFIIKNQNGIIVDLTSGVVSFVVKLEIGSLGETVFKKDSDLNGITLDNPTMGECTLKLIPSDTENLIAKEYQYELLIELPDGAGGFDRYTAEIDILSVKGVLIP